MIVTLAIITGILGAIALFIFGQIAYHVVASIVKFAYGMLTEGSAYYHRVMIESIKASNAQGVFRSGQVSRYGIPVPSNFKGLEDQLKL